MNHTELASKTAEPASIILFDGVCNLCNGTVQFIIKRDPSMHFGFASLQSEAGRALVVHHGLDPDELDSVVLIEDGRAYTRSTAALRIVRRLPGAWPLLYVLVLVPRPLRNMIYNLIAKNRYNWFGRQLSCMLPTAENRRRFLA
ncbi:MAG: thiol-disulfide oxidoreductase DCC family protein [Bradymonadaceae bacterium]|nr:thiol-disulfide oxidoreductase DCC family protein [Lujinxingiaceae bacterium]